MGDDQHGVSLIALLVGSRTADAPARGLAQSVAETLEQSGHITFVVDAGAVTAAALVDGDTTDPTVDNLVAVVDAADAVVLISPAIRAGHSGTSRLLLELLPDDALAGLPVVTFTTGAAGTGLDADAGRELDSAVRALGGVVLQDNLRISVFDMTRHACATVLDERARTLVRAALARLHRALGDTAGDPGDRAELIDEQAALRRIRDGALLLDVRSDPTLGAGLLPGAVHVRKADLATLFRPAERGHPALTGPEREIVVVCNSEQGSGAAVRQLRAFGYRRLAHVRGGAAPLAAALHDRATTPH
ncbi:rhodanese-like domain-containing protein [Nocardia sp. BMG111209]|uniref:rhodanese-like domain-containing protein n=1 Tax=Nocardia sp. BMG111209 TaxID=1160137 RepID=UPI000374CBF9|nr:rhodanese-like domain-containing protein [Nocardia sp. BMG111209]